MSRYRLSTEEQVRRQALRISKHQGEAAMQIQHKLQRMQENIAPFLEEMPGGEPGASSGSKTPAKRMHMTPCFASKVPTGRLLDASLCSSKLAAGRAATEQPAMAGCAYRPPDGVGSVAADPLDDAIEGEICAFFKGGPPADKDEAQPQYRFLRRAQPAAQRPAASHGGGEIAVPRPEAADASVGEGAAGDSTRVGREGEQEAAVEDEDEHLEEKLAWWRGQADLFGEDSPQGAAQETQPERCRRPSGRESLELDGHSEWLGVSGASSAGRRGAAAVGEGAGTARQEERLSGQDPPLTPGSVPTPKRVAAATPAKGSPADPALRRWLEQQQQQAEDEEEPAPAPFDAQLEPPLLQTPLRAKGVVALEALDTTCSLLGSLGGTQAMSLSALIAEQAAALTASTRQVEEQEWRPRSPAQRSSGSSPRRRLFDTEAEVPNATLRSEQGAAVQPPYSAALAAQAVAEVAAEAAARSAAQAEADWGCPAGAAHDVLTTARQEDAMGAEPASSRLAVAGQECASRGALTMARLTPRVVVSGPGPGRSPFSAWAEHPSSAFADSALAAAAAADVVAEAAVVLARGPADAIVAAVQSIAGDAGAVCDVPVAAGLAEALPQVCCSSASASKEDDFAAAALALTREWARELGVAEAFEGSPLQS